MGKEFHFERSRICRAFIFGLILLALASCSPSFVKPVGERIGVFPYTAFGTFMVKGPKGTHRGMWEIKAASGSNYRLTLYSSVGTLLGCTKVNGNSHAPCRKGMKDLGDTKAWQFLPKELFLKLPFLLSGEIGDSRGDSPLILENESGAVMKVRMLQREDEPFPHPIFLNVAINKRDCSECSLFLRIQVEEISKEK